MNETVKLILNVVSAAVIEVVIYIFLHESGHALVGLACGAKISAFSIVGAYTSLTGGTFNIFTSSLLKAGGMVFPLAISLLYILFIFDKNKDKFFYRLFSMFFSLVPVMSLWTWILVPVAYMAGDKTTPDDVIQFLNISGIHPVIIMSVSLLVFILMGLLAWKRGIVQIWIELVRGKNTKLK